MNSDSRKMKVVVLGGGISGLCCAHRLVGSFEADEVVCLEGGDRAGGYIQSELVDGYICDEGPNGFLDKEPATLEWIEELGISGELIRANEAAAKRYLLLNDRLVEMKPPPGFLLSPALSVGGRLRLLREPFVAKRVSDEAESIWDFAARRIGPEAADNLVSAMVLGVYGGDAKRLSLAHCFPRMAEMERVHGSLIKAMLAGKKSGTVKGGPSGPGGTLTTFESGIGRLTERAAEVLGDSLRLNMKVNSISKGVDNAYLIRCESGEEIFAENVICALPAHVATDLFHGFAPEVSSAVGRVRTEPIAVVCTGHKREDVPHSMDGFGFLVPPNQGKDVLGCIWSSSLFDGFAPDDRVYLRAMIGGAIHPEYVGESDEVLLGYMRKDVFPQLGIKNEPEFLKIYRHERGIPQYGLDHGEVLTVLADAERENRGLYFTGNSFFGISMNDCVKHGFGVCSRIQVSLSRSDVG